VRFRHVTPDRRNEYRAAVAAAGRAADELGAHFWVFEVDGDEGRFVEFSEGADDASLARLEALGRTSLAAAGPCFECSVEAEGLRTTAFV